MRSSKTCKRRVRWDARRSPCELIWKTKATRKREGRRRASAQSSVGLYEQRAVACLKAVVYSLVFCEGRPCLGSDQLVWEGDESVDVRARKKLHPALKWSLMAGRQTRLGGPTIAISGCATFVDLEPTSRQAADTGKDPGCPNFLPWRSAGSGLANGSRDWSRRRSMSANPGLKLPSNFINHRGLECADSGPFTSWDRRMVYHGSDTIVQTSKFRHRLSYRPSRANVGQMPSLRFHDSGDHRPQLAPASTSGIPHSLAFPGIGCKKVWVCYRHRLHWTSWNTTGACTIIYHKWVTAWVLSGEDSWESRGIPPKPADRSNRQSR